MATKKTQSLKMPEPRHQYGPTGKKVLSVQQEFEIMKLVLDKFLWLGFGIMVYGLYLMAIAGEGIYKGITFMVAGAVVLLLFLVLIVKEYEILK